MIKYGNPENYSFEERAEVLRSTMKTIDAVHRRYKLFIDCNPAVEDKRLTEGIPSVLEKIWKKYNRVLGVIEKPGKNRTGIENKSIKSTTYSVLLDVRQLEEVKRLLNESLGGDFEKEILYYQNLPAERRDMKELTAEDNKNLSNLHKITMASWCCVKPKEYWDTLAKAGEGEMRKLLKSMIESAEKGERGKVLELNRSYENLISKVYYERFTEPGLDFDNCRQSAVMAVTMPGMHKKFISDAKKRFSKLPKNDD